MNVNVQILLLVISCATVSVFAKTKCVSFTGKLECHKNPVKAGRVLMSLVDDDGAICLNPNDDMAIDYTEPNGDFSITGCGSDFGANTPDPYIEFHHQCNSEKIQIYSTHIVHVFYPRTWNFGTIVLDD